ncbi:MAG: hypothetical protein R2834_13555 [Rhodothermales bacterium]
MLESVFGQPSWRLATPEVELALTQQGGHLGPARFQFGDRAISPFHVAPWWDEPATREALPPMLATLRGDFFCLPFGANDVPYEGESHPPHGESSNEVWTFEGREEGAVRTTLHLSLETRVRKGRLDKRIALVDGHHAIYSEHVITGMEGPLSPGHHAMLAFPDEEGSGVLSTSPFVWARTAPEPLEKPEQRGYSFLAADASFERLDAVPSITGEPVDLTRFPARRGFEDLAMIVSDPSLDIAWTAVVFPRAGYVWFALKDPRVLRNTIFWLSNGGRHYPPWNGRHAGVMGIEEVTAYFHYGLAGSADHNPLSDDGFPTTLHAQPGQPLVIRYIMAVQPVPAGFDRVERLEAAGDQVRLVSASGIEIVAPLDVSFITDIDA